MYCVCLNMCSQENKWNLSCLGLLGPSLLNPLLLPLSSCCFLTCNVIWFLSSPVSWNCSPRWPGTSWPSRDLSWVSFPETTSVAVDSFLLELLIWLRGFCVELSSPLFSWQAFLCQGCQVHCLVTQSLIFPPLTVSLTPPPHPAPCCFSLNIAPFFLVSLPHPSADLLEGHSASSPRLVLPSPLG